ncbi:lysophospholipid acyltransferase family protein [Williamsia herbipolensis]|uniref:lysophospholipid acyltransferase family protein n=1 Tax=Williamsia herbipolensis TaxID=1603258 RepID=UPI0005F7F806|nr:lysophospholipid acyltransferase family protein [Williamsia herbipolensis]
MATTPLIAVTLENADAVYRYYAEHQQPRWKSRFAYFYLARTYRPRVGFDGDARGMIAALIRSGVPMVICANHLTDRDQFILAATAWRSTLRPRIGHTRVLAKDELFVDPGQRAKIDMMGGIPVFRAKNHDTRTAVAAGRQMIDICVERAAATGDSIAIFPEGTRNENPAVLLPIASGVGHIGSGIARRTPVALVSIGIAYPDASCRDAEVVIGEPRTIAATDKPAAITRTVRVDLQHAVDLARDRLAGRADHPRSR